MRFVRHQAARPWPALVFLCVLGASTASAPPGAEAKPSGPMLFCATYAEHPVCQGQLPTCAYCHTSTYPPGWNSYGAALFPGLMGDFAENLDGALRAIESKDSDGDGLTNAQELALGTAPGDPTSAWHSLPPLEGEENPAYKPETYDQAFALRRVALTYCGEAPSYDEVQAFRGLADDAARKQALHDRLDGCLKGSYWRQEALPRLADERIRPIFAIGKDSPVGIRLADYTWDYALFTYVMTGGRDMRDLLLATYHVRANGQGALERVEGPISGSQPLDAPQRAGMITTQWFLMVNTMFSALPRTTAAQAYRSYLGADISKYQGIWPVQGEPIDVDGKNVKQDECASCHSTLDPLSYAFAEYNGINGGTGSYDAGRPARLIPGWMDNQTVLFGQEVSGVRAWAEAAAQTDAFKRTMGLTLFQHALQRDPRPGAEVAEFIKLWRSMPEDAYSADKFLHRLIDTDAFGAP